MSDKTSDILYNLPKPLIIENARKLIRANNQGKKIVVLDDDPTGCQTVHGIHVLLHWDEATLSKAIEAYGSFYILHNSRSLTEKEAFELNSEISNTLLKLVPKENLTVISRSDSTLRGHFLAEITALEKVTGPYDGIIAVPYFREGGRLTLNNEHYVVSGETMTPAVDTEFAKDPVFGFTTSNLPEWIEDKTKGKSSAKDVIAISLDDLRIGGLEKVEEILLGCNNGRYVVINATHDEDLDVVILALQKATDEGKRFLFRSAASLVKVIMGLEDKPLWQPDNIGKRGVIIAGSHVKKTSDQLKYFMESGPFKPLELSIKSILHKGGYFTECVDLLNKALVHEETVLIYTERTYQLSGSDQERLETGRKISDFLSGLINNINIEPDFIIAKGGNTSNDVAKFGLKIVDAEVLGQILPGIPVWKPDMESKFPNCTYVVFPGNVGDEESLRKVYEILTS